MTNQIVSTPNDLIEAVERRFGKLTIDLAANASNAKAPVWFGPGGAVEDALSVDRTNVLRPGDVGWLNNPFRDTARWVEKCRSTVDNAGVKPAVFNHGWKILQQIPASVCTEYTTKYINGVGMRLELSPRPYKTEVRDVMLIVWTPEKLSGIAEWRWK